MSRERLAFVDVHTASMIARTYFRLRKRQQPGARGLETVRVVWRDYLRELLGVPAGGESRSLRSCSAVRLFDDAEDERPCA
jgi:hypothetical protein